MARHLSSLTFLLSWSLGSLTLSAASDRERPSDDAVQYAARFDVDLGEAERRLALQDAAGDLDAALSEAEKGIFAGLWIEHEPEFHLVLRFTEPAAAQRLERRLTGGPLAERLEVRSAEHSLVELERAQLEAHRRIAALGIEVESELNVFENRVELRVADANALATALGRLGESLPAAVRVVESDDVARPQQGLLLLGGRPLSTCTAGFPVRSFGVGQLGLSTAAHCGNTQFFAATSLPFRAEDQQGNQDVQWHSGPCGTTVTNTFDSGIGIRALTGTRSRSSQAIGAMVCKHGMTTGYTCGDIVSKSVAPSYVTSAAATFIKVGNGGNLSDPGDSGGPWFVETIAYGTHSGGYDNGDALYMPIEYISSLNVAALTFNPGAGGALTVTLSCSGNYRGSLQVSCTALTTGGTPPYGYSWTYSGTAGSWSSGGPYAYAYYSGTGCGSGNVNFFTVTVTDACGQSQFRSIGSLPCF